MIRTFSARTADQLWLKIAKSFPSDRRVISHDGRGGTTKELLHVGFSISNPRQRWVASRVPAINPAFALAEVVWIMKGSDDASFINHWNPILPRYSGDDVQYYGAYGNRLTSSFGFNQLDRAYDSLRKNPTSRQVILQIWHPRQDLPKKQGQPRSEDVPCNISSLLKIREGKLEWLQIMRSNDLFLGLPHNIVQFTTLQEIMAGWLGYRLGSYNQMSDSLHIYSRDSEKILRSKERSVPPNKDKLLLNKADSDFVFEKMFERMNSMIIAQNEKDYLDLAYLSGAPKAYTNMLLIIAADSCRRKGWFDMAGHLVSDCTNSLFVELWHNWNSRTKNFGQSNF